MKKRQQGPAAERSRRLKLGKTFAPLPVDDGDELYLNGIFEFNVTKMRAFINANPDRFPVEHAEVEPLRGFSPERLDEETINRADLSRPIILAEISPGRFNVIDGNHRVEKASRDGRKTMSAFRVGAEQHLAFLTSVRACEAYVNYWDSKLDDL